MRLASIAATTAMLLAALTGGGASIPDARADGSVTIALTPDGQQLAHDLGLDVAEFQRRIEAKMAELYDTANVGGFIRSFANATSFASRGTGVDYAPLFRNLEVGLTVNLAAAVDGLDPAKDPAAGIAPNLALMAGLNLAHWGHPELGLYVHGMHQPSATVDSLTGSISNVGGHVQYHLFFPKAGASTLLFLWSGLHLTAGVEYSRWSLQLEHDLTRDVAVAGATASTTLTTTANGTFDLQASSLTIPIELTTSARIAYFVGLYGGIGLDLQYGKANANATLAGDVRGISPTTGAPIDVGTATITMSGESGPTAVAYHVLAGVEANVWRLKLFTQGTFVPFSGASVAVGLRLKL